MAIQADHLDVALYVFFGVFLFVAIICYGWEIWWRTEWRTVPQQLRKVPSTLRRWWRKAFHCIEDGQWWTDVEDGNNTGAAKDVSPKRSSTGSRLENSTASDPNGTEHIGEKAKAKAKAKATGEICLDQSIPSSNPEATAGGWDSAKGNGEKMKVADEVHVKPSFARFREKWTWRRSATWIPGIVWSFSVIVPLLQLRAGVSSDHGLLRNSTPIWDNTTIIVYSENTNASDVNGDIGGIGIRAGLYIPACLALLTLLVGFFHREDTGAKEIGSVQLLTLFYLNFNAFKAATASFRTLTFPELVIACMTIDFTAAGLHMTTSGKETLAARWFVAVSAMNQIFAAVMVIAMLARIKHNYTSLPGVDIVLPSVDIVWWSRINSKTGPSPAVWTYIAVRCLILAHGLWLDVRYSPTFHILEKDWSSLAGADQEMERAKEQEDLEPGERYVSEYEYAVLPATVFGKWIEWLPSLLVATASTESLVTRLKFRNDIRDWGQSAALVLAIAGVMHWTFVTGQVIREIQDNQCFYHWLKQVMPQMLHQEKRPRRPVNYPRFSTEWKDKLDISGLLQAAEDNKIATVRKLLSHGAKIDTHENGKTPLLYAIRYRNVDFVRELVKKRARLNVQGTLPAFLFAAKEGHDQILSFLQYKKADPLQLDPRQGKSALWLASRNGHEAAMKFLLDTSFKAEPTATGEVVHSWTPDKTGRSPLYAAAEARHYGAVKMLVSRLCLPGSRSPGYFEAMERAATKRCDAALECLIRCGTKDLYLDSEGSTILHDAVRHHDFMPIPLPPRGLLDAPDSIQRGALDEQMQGLHTHLAYLAKIFSESQATINIRDAMGRTPLSIAVRSDHDNSYNNHAVQLLLRYTADAFAKDLSGQSPFLRYVYWRGQYVRYRFVYTIGLPSVYPFLHCILAGCSNYGLYPGGNISSDVAAGLLDLPSRVLYWLAAEGWVIMTSNFGDDRSQLIARVISSRKMTAFIALVAGNIDIPPNSFRMEIGTSVDHYRQLADSLKSMWDTGMKQREESILDIVEGCKIVRTASSSRFLVLIDPDSSAPHQINFEAQEELTSSKWQEEVGSGAGVERLQEANLRERVESFYQQLSKKLLDLANN